MTPLFPHTLLRTSVAAALLGASLAASAASPAWLQPGFDSAHTWTNPQEKTLKPGNVARLGQVVSQQLGQFYLSSTTQSDGVLFSCSNLEGLSAIDLASGTVQWSRFGFGGNCSPATLDDQAAYVSTADAMPPAQNTLTAVRRSDGATLWTAYSPPADEVSYLGFQNPTLAGGHLFVANGRSLVSAFDASTGHLRWRAATGMLNTETTVAGKLVYVGTWGNGGSAAHKVFAYSANDGTLKWSQPTDTSNMQYSPAVAGGRVFVGSDSGKVRAFDATTGAALWTTAFTGYVSAPIVATPQAIIVNTGNRTLTALKASSGEVLWTTNLQGSDSMSSNLVLANDVLYYTATDGSGTHRLVTRNARTGQPLSRASDTLWGSYAQLTVVNGRVFVSTSQGYLQVFALK